jgi:hypothetical protein
VNRVIEPGHFADQGDIELVALDLVDDLTAGLDLDRDSSASGYVCP